MVLLIIEDKMMKKEFGVSYFDSKGVKHWLIFENKFLFTKSKAEFFRESVIKKGSFTAAELTVEAS